jgi:predicted Zn-dependent protease
MKPLTLSLLLSTLLLSFTGCTTVPATGNKAIILLPEDSLIAQSNSMFSEMRKTEKVSTNRQYNDMAQRVGKRIAEAVKEDMPATDWEFIVFEGQGQANAFALPGGKVGIYTGIFELCDQDADLATVVSHEIAHVAARHGNQRASMQILQVAGGAILDTVMQKQEDKTRTTVMAAYGVGTTVGGMLPFSRNHELEADRLGLHYMARAGYDPERAIVFWQRMMEKQNGNIMPEFLSTHPAHQSRIAALKENIALAKAEYQAVK